jgi:hypothetical protein
MLLRDSKVVEALEELSLSLPTVLKDKEKFLFMEGMPQTTLHNHMEELDQVAG